MVDNNSQELDPDLDLGLDVPLSSQDSFSELWNDVVVNSSIYTNYANTDEDENRMEIECEKLIIAAPNNAEALMASFTENLGQAFQQSQHNTNLMNFPTIPTVDTYTAPDSTHSSRIPSNKNWTGEYDFKIAFQEQSEKMTKSTSWTYSEMLDKLFINVGVSCMVGFKVSRMPPSGCVIRALPIFDKSEHVIEVVKRCPTHRLPSDPSNTNHCAPDHLVRCDNEHAQYLVDPNGRQSVVVPFEGPQAGADNSQYLYRFMCLGSCVGGLNRRPLLLIFTLEKDGNVIGRRVLRVRICACPGRDRKSEEKSFSVAKDGQKKNQTQTTSTDLIVIEPQSKKQKVDDEIFTIHVRGRANYELLMKVKQSLELSALVPKEVVDEYYNSQHQLELTSPAINRSILSSSLAASGGCLPSTSTSYESSTIATLTTGNPKPSLKKLASISENTRNTREEESTSDHLQLCFEPRVKKDPDESITSWLTNIGMAGYADMFLKKGLKSMSQLENFTEEDLTSLRIGEAHQEAIWKALQERFGLGNALLSSQQSTCSNVSQTSSLVPGQPSIIQIARYRFKRVTSLKSSNDHNYT